MEASRRIQLNRNGRWFAPFGQLSTSTNRQGFTTFSQPHLPILPLKSSFGELCTAAFVLFLKVRVFSYPHPKVSKGFLQMSQSLLQRYTAHFIEKLQIFLFFSSGEHSRRLDIANFFLPLVLAFHSYRQRSVVNQTRTTHCPTQERFLFVRWIETITVGFLHSYILANSRVRMYRSMIYHVVSFHERKCGRQSYTALFASPEFSAYFL